MADVDGQECSLCGVVKPVNEFSTNGRGGRHRRCNLCGESKSWISQQLWYRCHEAKYEREDLEDKVSAKERELERFDVVCTKLYNMLAAMCIVNQKARERIEELEERVK